MLSQQCILTLETLPFPIPSALPPCYGQQIMFHPIHVSDISGAPINADISDIFPHDRFYMLHLTHSIIQIPSGCPEFLLPTYLTYRAALKIPINLSRLFPAPQSPIKMFPRSVNKIKLYFTLAAYLQCLTGKKD